MSQKRLKKSSSDYMVEFSHCTNTANEKMQFSCFQFCQVVAEAQVI